MNRLHGDILVVEDSDEDFDTLRDAMRAAALPHNVLRATSGEGGLALLRGGGERPGMRPSLVLMDLNSPGIDGREALEAIKSDPLLRHLPVVVLSTSSNVRDLDDCYRNGANAYHVKPVRYPEHRALLGAILDYWLVQVSAIRRNHT